ncbi:MAG: hypothetical protein Q9220_004134 [cf. Caloplaca sp. 1 TL-2023]
MDGPESGTTFADGEALQYSPYDYAGLDARTIPHVEPRPSSSAVATADGPDKSVQKENIPGSAMTLVPIRLIDIRDILQLERHHQSRALTVRREVDDLVMGCGIDARLLASHASVYQEMADCYQTGSSEEFANLYHGWETLAEACAGRILHQAPDKAMQYQTISQELPQPVSWMENLSADCQDCVLDFLTTLRTDPRFFADRLSALPASDFVESFGSSTVAHRPHSIFNMHPSQKPFTKYLPSSRKGEPPEDRMRHLHQDDPFFVLFHCLFGLSCKPESTDDIQRRQVWSTACARVISEEKTGSDDFIMKILDTLCDASTWDLRSSLEHFISSVLQKGAFLLYGSSKEPLDFKEPQEIRNANAAIAASKFFDKALKDLMAMLLSGPEANILPKGVLHFVSSTLNKIPNLELRGRARNFIASRTDARNTILREIAIRLQRQMSDVLFSWKSTSPVLDPEMHTLVSRMLARFDVGFSTSDQKSLLQPSGSPSIQRAVMLSARDVSSLLRALYPELVQTTSPFAPSTARSSTLVPEAFHYSKSDQISFGSDQLSVGSSIAYKGSLASTWMTDDQSDQTETARGPVFTRDERGQFIRQKDRLIHTYKCLDGILGPSLASSSAASLPNWTCFHIDGRAMACFPKTDRIQANDDTVLDTQADAAQPFPERTHQLQSSIKRLLADETGPLGNLPRYPQSTSIESEDFPSELEALVEAAIDRAIVEYRYQDMHHWWRIQRLLKESRTSVDAILRAIHAQSQQTIAASLEAVMTAEQSHYTFTSLRDTLAKDFTAKLRRSKSLRVKMWYDSDVRHSSTFEDARHVTQALKAMVDKSRLKQPSGIANWARQRLRNTAGPERYNSQMLEALTEPNEHSGISKLNDEQVERTARWLTKSSIENFCRGEERIHRFCYEIKTCVKKLTGPSLLESPVLWSSRLFEGEHKAYERKPFRTNDHRSPQMAGVSFSPLPTNYHMAPSTFPLPQRSDVVKGQRNSPWIQPPQNQATGGIEKAIAAISLNDSSPREPIRSSSFQPLRLADESLDLPPSLMYNTSGYAKNAKEDIHRAKQVFLTEIRESCSSLILSDLGCLLWHAGTETDVWVRRHSAEEQHLSGKDGQDRPSTADSIPEPQRRQSPSSGNFKALESLLNAAPTVRQTTTSTWEAKHSSNFRPHEMSEQLLDEQNASHAFPYKQSYERILEKFSLSNDAQIKLRMLLELENLVSCSIEERSLRPGFPSQTPGRPTTRHGNPIAQNTLVPRTKATSLEEVIANCTERRAGTLEYRSVMRPPLPSPEPEVSGTDEIVETLLRIFRDPSLCPPTLFRDLQYIAAFVPAEILDHTPEGKAFWDAGLAALALKQDLCDAMVVRATDITTHHIATSASSPPAPSPSADLSHTTLSDAAELWMIAAKEGSATAARELGLLYLTHPEYLPRTTLQPFSKPMEVFRMVGGGAAKKEGAATKEEGRLDPVTFAVVFHWMEVAANGGDRDARDFLRGNGELGTVR